MRLPDRSPARARRRWRCFLSDERGAVAIIFSLILPSLVAMGGVALDYSRLSAARGKLQAVADSAALAAAREFRLGNADLAMVNGRADAHARANLEAQGLLATVTARADNARRSITVEMTASIPLHLMPVLGLSESEVRVSATARMVGGSPLCVVALDGSANHSLLMEKNARLEAPGCAVYSNSTRPNGLMAKNNATMRAGFICSAGGRSSPGPGTFNPQPQTDCPPLPDPLLSRPLPVAGACRDWRLEIRSGVFSLQPGTYCEGLTIMGATTRVTLLPGVYVFKDGPLRVGDGASLSGVNVGLHFTGRDAALTFDPRSTISLTAPSSGDMAGLLLTEDRAGPGGFQHRIMSDDARNLLGTIYLPRSELFVGANRPVADQSAYTIVVARQFSLSEGPTMVLNTNYGATNIPVPNGVGPTGGATQLSH